MSSTATPRSTSQSLSFNPALEEKIRLRAYEIYLRRGAAPGSALEDWVRAESEITAKPVAEAPAKVVPLTKPRVRKATKK